MPYVSREAADRIDAALGRRRPGSSPERMSIEEALQTPGDLTYAITRLIAAYLAQRMPLRFQTIAEVVGALYSARDEFGERVQRPYESHKRLEGGADPYGPLGL
jgi:hypothetical protein